MCLLPEFADEIARVLSRKDPRQAEQEFFDAVDFFAAGATLGTVFVRASSCRQRGGSAFDFGKFLDFFRMVSAVHEAGKKRGEKERGVRPAVGNPWLRGRRRVPADDLQRLRSLAAATEPSLALRGAPGLGPQL